MKQKPEILYLDLMKKTLMYTLWPEPPSLLTTVKQGRPLDNRFPVSTIAKILNIMKISRNNITYGLHIVREYDFSEEARALEGIPRTYAHTMIGLKSLDNIQSCIETVLSKGIEGDLIETGVWRGGACIFMRAVLAAYGIEDRKVFVADSFEGLPKPDAEKYPADKGDKFYTQPWLAVSQEEVENNFSKYGLLDNQVVFLKGWFKDTLPQAPIEKLSILRLDGDMYGSTIESLESLYPKLSRGGFCIIDDYCFSGCKSAVNDFRLKHKIDSEIKEIDYTGIYWIKE